MRDFSSEILSLLYNTFENLPEWAAVSLIVAYFFLRQMVNFRSSKVRQSVCILWGIHKVVEYHTVSPTLYLSFKNCILRAD